MQKYAKITDGKIEFAPQNKGSISNYNLSVELMTVDGYKPLVVIEEPTEEKPLVKYRETDKQIEQYAEAVPQPEPYVPTKEQKAVEVRVERDRRIDAIMWRVERYQTQLAIGVETSDTETKYKKILKYIQALRDITLQETFPEYIEWPKEPQ